jgi:hypothetical protein
MRTPLLGLLGLLLVACDNPAGPVAGSRCRVIPASMGLPCEFRGTMLHCRTSSDNLSFGYASRADFVDEARVPHRPRLITRDSGGTRMGRSGYTSIRYAYDGKGRLVSSSVEGGGDVWGTIWRSTRPAVTTYSSWDRLGRPTRVHFPEGSSPREATILYDDTARTATWSTGYVVEQDENGYVVRETFDAGTPHERTHLTRVRPGGEVCEDDEFRER